MGTLHQITTGQRVENSETLAEQEALKRMEGFLLSEINRLSPQELDRNNFYYSQEIEQKFNRYLEPDTENRAEGAGRIRSFLEQEEKITANPINRPLYFQYWEYLHDVYVLGLYDKGFEQWKVVDDTKTAEWQEELKNRKPFSWQERLEIEDVRNRRADIHATINEYEESPEPPQKQLQHPAVGMLQQLQESQPEPQRLRFRDRLKDWFKSW